MSKNPRILLDMDCVIADFVGPALAAHGLTFDQVRHHWPAGEYGMTGVVGRALGYGEIGTLPERNVFTDAAFWAPINVRRGFWASLPKLPWADEMVDLVRSKTDDYYIVTSPSRCRECVAEKYDWLCRWWGMDVADRMVPTRYERGPAVYLPMPADRPHPCHDANAADIPVNWIEYDPKYGFSIDGTNAYGDGTYCDGIKFCPWCGVELKTEEK